MKKRSAGAAPIASLEAFTLDRYDRVGVGDILLDLQDRLDADICVLLFALWCGQRAVVLSDLHAREIAGGDAGTWHREIVCPLRVARRAMKTPPAALAAAQVEIQRGRLKEIELASEMFELQLLDAFLRDRMFSDRPPSTRDRRQAVARDNLSACLGALGAGGEADDAISSLVRACVD